MHDIAEFLRSHEPFGELDEAALEELAGSVEVEFFAAGTTILLPGDRSANLVRVVRRGTVELVEDGRVLDLLGEGEMVGHPSMLSGLPAGLEVRAGDDALCYRLAAEDVVPLMARTSTPKIIGGAEMEARTAASLIGEQPVLAQPGLAVREAVMRMQSEGASSVLVPLNGGGFGIVTDRDLRSKLIARGRSADTAVSEVMSAPARCVGPEQTGAELMLLMLDHGINHLPVVAASSEVLGVVRNIDLLGAQTRIPFTLRRAIADAVDREALAKVAGQLDLTVVALHQAGLAPRQISATISVVFNALTRRMIEIAMDEIGPPPAEFAWLALGSDGRREAAPSSDVDSGLVWRDQPGLDDDEARRYMHALAEQVDDTLVFTGWRLDAHGVTASGEFSCNSASGWRRALGTWLTHPEDEKVLIATSILLDGRTVFGPDDLNPKQELFEMENRETLLRWLLRLGLAAKPPTGFMRDIVVEHSGEHRGTLDIKHGGMLPVVELARYAGLKAGVTATSTIERLRAGAESGALEKSHARTLEAAFDLFLALRFEHQVHQLERGEVPDDNLDPKNLDPLTRRYLRDAFREVAAVQRALAGGLAWATN